MSSVETVPDTPEVNFWQEDYLFLIRREIAEWTRFLMMRISVEVVIEV